MPCQTHGGVTLHPIIGVKGIVCGRNIIQRGMGYPTGTSIANFLGKTVMRILEDYYGWFRWSLYVLLETSPCGIPLTTTFDGNTPEQISTKLKVDRYCAPN